jgi:hypothetical protein
MKKEYIEPQVKIISEYDQELMQNASPGVTGNTTEGTIPYGGVDEDGTKDPEAKQNFSVWEEETDNSFDY